LLAEEQAEQTSALEIEAEAVRLLAQREHSLRELSGKLARRFGRVDLVQQVLGDLELRGLVSDERFTESYVAMRLRKGFGPLRIRSELQERGIDSALIEAHLELGGEAWMEQLREAAAQRFGMERPGDRAAQAKQARFLQYRGFPESLVRRYLWG
jgi:regulatory protein